MKKQTEKPPIDELFARKLGNMSMPPNNDGFARLQARMGQPKQEAKIVFWRNPDIQRYMAAAACLLLVCLFGWLYWPSSGNTVEQTQGQVATNQLTDKSSETPILRQSDKHQKEESGTNIREREDKEFGQNLIKDQVATADKGASGLELTSMPVKRSVNRSKTIDSAPLVVSAPGVAKAKLNDNKVQNDAASSTAIVINNLPKATIPDQVAENKPVTKPTPVAERVLVVTIAEPEALVAARQTAKAIVDEKPAVAQNDKPEKESKVNSLWQQVKRIKQGEVFARQDNTDNEEGGLLGRAYNGIKHSLDKDKSTKQ